VSRRWTGLLAAGSMLAILALLWSATAEAEDQAKADVVLRNGKIYTADKTRSIKQALAFRGNTILAVGSNEDVTPLIGAGQRSSTWRQAGAPGADRHSHPSDHRCRDSRHQIAHLQLVDPADFPRFKELGMIADMQLDWAKREPATEAPLEPYLGPDRYRYRYLYPAGSLHPAAPPSSAAAIGTFRPITRFTPFKPPSRGRGATDSRLSTSRSAFRLPQRSTAYTINAAYAMKQDATTGSLEAGKRAHLVVLDRDIRSVDPETIADTKVVATYLDGQLVYAAPTGGAAEPEEDKKGAEDLGEMRQACDHARLHHD
jgi:predicted amidohydrolase YtcJ